MPTLTAGGSSAELYEEQLKDSSSHNIETQSIDLKMLFFLGAGSKDNA